MSTRWREPSGGPIAAQTETKERAAAMLSQQEMKGEHPMGSVIVGATLSTSRVHERPPW